jgi:hypothetical protein
MKLVLVLALVGLPCCGGKAIVASGDPNSSDRGGSSSSGAGGGAVAGGGPAAGGSGGSAGNSVSEGSSAAPGDETASGDDDAGGPGMGVSSGGCPSRENAAACPTLPPRYAIGFPNGAWVGCSFTDCLTPSACTTCTCFADQTGAAWDCVDGGLQTEGVPSPSPYCALNSGPVDAGDLADVGPVERCTAEYPVCSPPYPESPGWQCCRVSASGAVNEITCMPIELP